VRETDYNFKTYLQARVGSALGKTTPPFCVQEVLRTQEWHYSSRNHIRKKWK